MQSKEGPVENNDEKPKYRKWGDERLPQRWDPVAGKMVPRLEYPCIAPPMPPELAALHTPQGVRRGFDPRPAIVTESPKSAVHCRAGTYPNEGRRLEIDWQNNDDGDQKMETD